MQGPEAGMDDQRLFRSQL
jgi:hypothetical protein